MEYNEADRIVEGFGNVSIIDNQGDFVPITRMSELMPIYMRRGGILMDSHTNRHVGNIMHWELRDKDGKDAIYLWAKIFNDYSIDDMVWKAIGNKHYTGFSFGGRSVDKDVKCTDGVCFNNIKDLEVWEWSIVPKPANKESIFTKFNEIAKGDKMSTVLVPRVEDGSVIYDQVEMAIDNGMMYKSDEMEKAGSQSRGPKQTSAKEYGDIDIEDVGDRMRAADKGKQYPQRGTDSRFKLPAGAEESAQVYGSKHGGLGDRSYAGEGENVRSGTKKRTEAKAKRIGERIDREAEKMDDYQSPEVQEEEKMDEMEKGRRDETRYGQKPSKTVGLMKDPQRSDSRHGLGFGRREDMVDSIMYGRTPEQRATDDKRGAKDSAADRNYKRNVAPHLDKGSDREEEKMDNTQEVAKEDSPMTAPAEDAGNPMNKILSILESIDGRLTALEGGNEEKAELEDMPPEAEKAEAAKKVTVPEPPKQQEAKILQKGDSISPEMLTDIAGELKKMGYEQASTPKPSVDGNFPLSDVQTVGDILQKSDTGAVDIHSQLGEKSFKDIDLMFGGL